MIVFPATGGKVFPGSVEQLCFFPQPVVDCMRHIAVMARARGQAPHPALPLQPKAAKVVPGRSGAAAIAALGMPCSALGPKRDRHCTASKWRKAATPPLLRQPPSQPSAVGLTARFAFGFPAAALV